MEGFKFLQLIAILSTLSVVSVEGQISTACTASMISNFTPCLNFITGSSGIGTSSPTQGCFSSLKSLMNGSMDCACLIFTASVPIQLPINRTLAISLPQACNMGGVPVQCKASGTPLPAPGPVPFLLPPTLPPTAASPLSPGASKASGSESDAPLDLAPASPPEEDEEPEAPSAMINPGIRPVIQPMGSSPSYVSPPLLLTLLIGVTIFMFNRTQVKKHIKQGPGHEGDMFTVEAPLHASNVQVLDPVTRKPCKVGVKYLEDGTKVRVSRGIGASGSIIPRPEILKLRTTPRPTVAGPKDTPMDLVLERTYGPKSGKGMPDL